MSDRLTLTTMKPAAKTQFSRLLAVGIFVSVVLYIPWESLYGAPFEDRAVYYKYFLSDESILEYTDLDSVADYITNEVLWHFTIRTLIEDLGLRLDSIFQAISGFCISIFGILLVRRQNPLSLVLLINPLMIDLAFSQLRSALAVALLYAAFLLRKLVVSVPIVIFVSFLHTATFLLLAIAFIVWLGSRYLERRSATSGTLFLVLCAIGVVASIALGPMKDVILGYMGDRRVGLGDAGASLAYTSFWIVFLAILPLQWRSLARDPINRFSVVALSLVAANLVTGGYSLRMLSFALPLLVSTMLSVQGYLRLLIVMLWILYSILQWAYWLKAW